MQEIKVYVLRLKSRKYLQLRFTDPNTGRQVARSARTTRRRDAEKAAGKWEAELREGRYKKPSRITWKEFRWRYVDEKMSGLKSLKSCMTAFNHLERVMNPARLSALTSEAMSKFQADLRREGMKDSSLATHLRHIRAALNWAASIGLLIKAPTFKMPRRPKGQKLMRGRPISANEFDSMLDVVNSEDCRDIGEWKRYLQGLWFSGLRLDESLRLSWNENASFSVDFSGRRPRFRIYAEAEKGNRDRLLPMTPDFAELLWGTPKPDRQGLVFQLGQSKGSQISTKRACRIISSLGRRAEVIVNKQNCKYATAHDLRRSFGTRWASKVKPATLQLLMRHQSIETTLKYYVDQDADEIADELWEVHKSNMKRSKSNKVFSAYENQTSPQVEKTKDLYFSFSVSGQSDYRCSSLLHPNSSQ